MPKYIYKGAKKSDNEQVAKNNTCKACDGKRKFTFWALCETCWFYWHPKCIGINEEDIRIDPNPFMCVSCQQQQNQENHEGYTAGDTSFTDHPLDDISNSLNTQVQEDGNDSADTDEEGESQVSEIVDLRDYRDGSREFLVRFAKDSQTLWIFEKDLSSCTELLNDFLASKKLPPTKVKSTSKPPRSLGSTSKQNINERNWRTIEETLEAISIYGSKDLLQPASFHGLTNKDGIYLLRVLSHCVAVLFYADSQTCLVADGEDAFINDPTYTKIIMEKLKGARKVVGARFYQQREKDHCTSSAAAIAIEFQKIHAKREMPDLIRAPDSILKRLRDKLHKEKGANLQGWLPVTDPLKQKRVSCGKCGKNFNSKNRSVLNLHRC